METNDNIDTADEITELPEARRMAESFVEVYQVTLIRIEQHLEDIIEGAGEEYAEGYEPWRKALHDLLSGSYLLAQETAMPDRNTLSEALRVFSFDSSIAFLKDLCSIVGIKTERGWSDRFRQHVHILMDALNILQREKMAANPA